MSTLTGTQVMLLVASETGHVYTFATRKLQPMITSDSGKALIQTCLNSPDPPPGSSGPMSIEQRMNPTGFEETELSYAVSEEENAKVYQLNFSRYCKNMTKSMWKNKLYIIFNFYPISEIVYFCYKQYWKNIIEVNVQNSSLPVLN